ncbi:hypothetical protein FPOA_03487 [Fusarium poae]|uniref:Uncharacterized protein n=1 Tax=Fusarium poae TaxID=36050 RepID=A0A1B8B9Y7_FUSPO|nr:hypothetical protein FPOA_03487 [Fusarium poae]
MSAPDMFEVEDLGPSQREPLPRQSIGSRRPSSINHPDSRSQNSEEHRPLAAGRDNEPSDGSVETSENEYQLEDLSEPPTATGIILRKAVPPPGTSNTKDTTGQKKDRENVFWIWKEELLLLVVAAGFFAGICRILYIYDEKELPHWDDLGITLNTLISIIATIFRASLAIITFEILAQLKWDWISSGSFRPMQQVQVFDSASRGILGCLRLIPIIAIQHPLALAAIFVTVSSIGIGSFTQQSIQTFQCRLPIQSLDYPATITTVNYAEFSDSWAGGIYYETGLDMKLKLAMKDAILSSREYSSLFSCPSGNCTFPTYSNGGGYSRSNQTSHASVGFCSRCSDIKKLVRGPEPLNSSASSRPRNLTVVYSLPNDLTVYKPKRMEIIYWPRLGGEDNLVLNTRTETNIDWAHEALDNEFLNRARWAAVNITILGASKDGCNDHQNGTFTCHEGCNEETESADSCRYSDHLHQFERPINLAAAVCTLYPCIKYFTAEVEDGQIHEKVEWDIPLRRERLDTPSFRRLWQGIMQPCLVNGTVYTSANASSPPGKIPNPAPVLFHIDDWVTENPRSVSEFVNVTVPADCIVELPTYILDSLRDEIRATYNTNCTMGHQPWARVECVQHQSSGDSSESHLATLMTDGTTSVSAIDKAMDSITTRLTNEIREVGTGPFGNPNPKVKGLVWETRACVHIEWYWLIFPGALLIMCAILLATIMVTDAKKKHVWKSSILPFLLKDHPGIQSLSIKGVAKVADGYEVKMETKNTV